MLRDHIRRGTRWLRRLRRVMVRRLMVVTAPATGAGRDEPAVCGFDSRLLVAHKNGQGGVGGKAVFSGSLRETKHGLAGFGRDAGFRVLRQDDAASVKELDSGGSGWVATTSPAVTGHAGTPATGTLSHSDRTAGRWRWSLTARRPACRRRARGRPGEERRFGTRLVLLSGDVYGDCG